MEMEDSALRYLNMSKENLIKELKYQQRENESDLTKLREKILK